MFNCRSQIVSFSGIVSENVCVKYRVPQGRIIFVYFNTHKYFFLGNDIVFGYIWFYVFGYARKLVQSKYLLYSVNHLYLVTLSSMWIDFSKILNNCIKELTARLFTNEVEWIDGKWMKLEVNLL